MGEIKSEKDFFLRARCGVRGWSRPPGEWHTLAAGSTDSVLLETLRFDAGNTRSFVFLDPVKILIARTLDQVPDLFRRIEEALAGGFYVAGYVSYECGYHFQPVDAGNLPAAELPLAWFGVYREPRIFEHLKDGDQSVAASPDADGSTEAQRFSPDRIDFGIAEEEYRNKILRIQDYIAAGDTYQVNFTDRVELQTTAAAVEVFAALSRRQPVAYSALLQVAGHQILSFSPELFFKVDGDRIITRPMKGTMPRGLDSLEDISAAVRLQNDPKNRAEHVMIVDLLRNDLGRICATGSVKVEDIFSVEKYRTLFQMTSTISGTLRQGIGYYDIFSSMFPGGSITGAPKIRTMQIIRELEQRPRGVYTGAIGFIAPDRSSVFNIAIRTLVLRNGQASMGVGGGIVADSRPEEEYRECLLKANFLLHSYPEFQLLETMLWNGEFTFLSMHLDRMESSASYFDFPFDRTEIASQLSAQAKKFSSTDLYRVRMLLDSAGQITINAAKHLPDRPTGIVRLASERTFSGDVFLRHKTTNRERYDRFYAAARGDGFDEVVFLNEKNEVTEGAISNLLVLQQGKLLTPPLSSGVLPGVFRRHLLETDATVEERVLTLEDIKSADALYLCNSVRGLRPVILRG